MDRGDLGHFYFVLFGASCAGDTAALDFSPNYRNPFLITHESFGLYPESGVSHS